VAWIGAAAAVLFKKMVAGTEYFCLLSIVLLYKKCFHPLLVQSINKIRVFPQNSYGSRRFLPDFPAVVPTVVNFTRRSAGKRRDNRR
jgi:hypothetical protein